MLVITKVQTIQVDGECVNIDVPKGDYEPFVFPGDAKPDLFSLHRTERVHGASYTDGYGELQIIGVSKQAREAMGLYAKAADASAKLFHESRNLTKVLYRKNADLTEFRWRLQELTWWQRFKYLLFGWDYLKKEL